MLAPAITIYVRHSTDCKYAADEFSKRCKCKKHLRWSAGGKQYRRAAKTRSWTEAEEVKRILQDHLAGRAHQTQSNVADLRASIGVFIEDKRVQGITSGVLEKYTRELARLCDYCERVGVFTVGGITRELLTGYCATWERLYPSTMTRSSVRTRCRGFLRYAYEARWLDRVPALPKIAVDEPPTLPLSADEYERLLEAVGVFVDPTRRARVRALLQLMRWSGLAIRDALTLPKAALRLGANGLYRVTTDRQKTGTHVSVPIPPSVAEEVLAVPNDGPFIFWDGQSDIVKSWTKYAIAPVFDAAKIHSDGYMVSHRLRDTFAVDLLEKGVPMEEVSRLLGHTSIRTTEKSYAKWSRGRQDRADSLVTATWSARTNAPKNGAATPA